jgi:hypothetical protein
MIEELTNYVVQTYYIPWPEQSMFNDFFIPINRNATKGQVTSIISLSISTDNTIIWYDHWEDGYDSDMTNVTTAKVTTEIWGDGNKTNGCQPTTIPCTDAADKLMAGTSFVIQSNITVTPIRNTNDRKYDGGDKLGANFPIAITRGGYPTQPGSLLAGAMEVMDTSFWGKDFIAPVGNNTIVGNNTFKASSFGFSAFLVMAREANTTVQLRGPATGNVLHTWILNEGQSRLITTRISQPLTTDKPVQVAMITGDIDSLYESRWYTLLDKAQWSKQYVTPTGETFGRTKLVLYNANNYAITVSMETRLPSGATSVVNVAVPKFNVSFSPYIQDNTGAYVYSNDQFMAMSITDSERKSWDNVTTDGQMYNWGFSVQPLDDLTSQVLVAWGYVCSRRILYHFTHISHTHHSHHCHCHHHRYGCTNNYCNPKNVPNKPRSVVWITPVGNADIYVDYENTGNPTKIPSIGRLQSIKITDPFDNDMSGAVIFATAAGGTIDSTPVNSKCRRMDCMQLFVMLANTFDLSFYSCGILGTRSSS